jgi:hypothetical protein
MQVSGKLSRKKTSPGSVGPPAISPHSVNDKTALSIQTLAISQIQPDLLNSRKHSAKQISQIANSIIAFGFTNPLLVTEDYELIAGEGRWRAANHLGLTTVPVIIIAGLSPAKRRALSIADNKIAENAIWDRKRLAIVLPELASSLPAEELEVSILGFEPCEIDQLQTDFEKRTADPWDRLDPIWLQPVAVTKPGDLWLMGQHKILCGDPCSGHDVGRLMTGSRADLAFLDPLPNLRGPAPACDTLRADGFLSAALHAAASVSRAGAVHFVCSDQRRLTELLAVAMPVYSEPIDVAVWVNPRSDRGTLYRNQIEFIGVFGVGATPPTIAHRQPRSNLWHHAPVTSRFHGDLSAKPIALIADVIKDCTKKRDIVLDLFSGAGSTVMAAERVGRYARALESDPLLVDLTIRRWQAFTGKDAFHAEHGMTFNQIAAGSAGTPEQDRT